MGDEKRAENADGESAEVQGQSELTPTGSGRLLPAWLDFSLNSHPT